MRSIAPTAPGRRGERRRRGRGAVDETAQGPRKSRDDSGERRLSVARRSLVRRHARFLVRAPERAVGEQLKKERPPRVPPAPESPPAHSGATLPLTCHNEGGRSSAWLG